MYYTFMPSLEHIALVKIATTLWNQDDIRALIAKFSFPLYGSVMIPRCPKIDDETKIVLKKLRSGMLEKWQEIENKVIEKVPQLSQPEPLKNEILSFIKIIGIQILKWMDYHRNLLSGDYVKKNVSSLIWTPQGTVDKERTAKILVQDENLDSIKRYKLACIYCLEDYIFILSRGRKFYGKDGGKISINEPSIVSFWAHCIGGEMRRYCQGGSVTYEFAFQCSAGSGNKTATEYFLQKLTPMEKEKLLVELAGTVAVSRHSFAMPSNDLGKEDYADVVCFLLSQMNKEQQTEVFKSYSCVVLECFLDWPWQRFFMEMANFRWDFLPEKDFNYLLRKMADKVIEGHKDYDYKRLFGHFWQQSPITHKSYIINECASGFLLSKLFRIKNEKNIKLILKDATPIEKKNLIFSEGVQKICQDLIYCDKWNSLEFFIQECISSKDEVIKFKECMKLCSIDELARNQDKYDKFFCLLHEFACRYDKRKGVEEGDSSPAKTLRSGPSHGIWS